MAPKRLKVHPPSRVDASGHVIIDTNKFPGPNEEFNYRRIIDNSVAQERGLTFDPPQLAYIDHHGWRAFASQPQLLGDRALLCEFYANLGRYENNTVIVRGKSVNFSSKTINALFRLKNIPRDDYGKLLTHPPSAGDLVKVLTGKVIPLPTNWTHLKRGDLTTEAKVWYSFVAARLMPTVLNSEVVRRRALLTYAVLTNASIDVGRLIQQEIFLFLQDNKAFVRSLSFPVIITMLCRQAGVPLTYEEGVVHPLPPVNVALFPGSQPPPLPPPRQSRGAGTSSQAQADEEAQEDHAAHASSSLADRISHLEQEVASFRHQYHEDMGQVHSQLAHGFQAMTDGFASMHQGFEALHRRFDTEGASSIDPHHGLTYQRRSSRPSRPHHHP